ncbi:MAG: response regulator [Planctomycetes bacterium]|nr:response regulator [Planctomycetota bacterium]
MGRGDDGQDLGDFVRAPVMVHSIGADGRILDVSDEWLRVLGYAREEVVGQPSVEFLSPASRAYARDTVLPAFFRTGECRMVSYDFVKKNGDFLPVLLSGVAIYDADGEYLRSIAVSSDVSEQRLRSAQLKLTFDAAGMQVWAWELVEGTWRWDASNELAFPLLAPGASFADYCALAHAEDRAELQRELEALLEHPTGGFTLTHRLAGEPRWLQVVGQVALDARGEPRRLIGAVRDVTREQTAAAEEQAFRERAEQAQRLESLGVLAGGIAHDFNNLLVAVLGNADLALKSLGRSHEAARNLEAIGNAAQRASDLCQQLLAYSGKGRFAVEAVDLAALVRDMAELLEVSVSKRAALQLDLASRGTTVKVDVVQMRQVVLNLITNASEAVEPGGSISLRVAARRYDLQVLRQLDLHDELAPGTYVVLEVADDGSGMSPQAQARIFDPFFTTKFTGRGLGLAAVLGIVKGHGGAIRVRSAVGEGTTFTVSLPAAGDPPQRSQRGEGPPPECLSGHVLVIDDQPEVLVVVRALLSSLGLEASTASGGLQGLAKYAERRADVVVLDMTMPEVDGYETFCRLRDLDPSARVILSSGYSEQDATDRFAGSGLAGFIQKPYRLKSFEALLRKVLNSPPAS